MRLNSALSGSSLCRDLVSRAWENMCLSYRMMIQALTNLISHQSRRFPLSRDDCSPNKGDGQKSDKVLKFG
jgi:hypothetical protein